MNRHDLEDRLINHSVSILELVDSMPKKRSAKHLGDQLIRSGTSSALNYGEAQSAESRNDFIHKIKVVLKELRETFIALTIVNRSNLYSSEELIKLLLRETDELIAIFVKSTKTVMGNQKK